MSDTTAPEMDGKAKGSLTGLLAAVAILTAIAGGGGWVLGGMISADRQVAASASGKGTSRRRAISNPAP